MKTLPLLREQQEVGVLFSGGIDSVAIAWLTCRILQEERRTNSCLVSLINVSFDGENSPDRVYSKEALNELLHSLGSATNVQYVPVNVEKQEVVKDRGEIMKLIYPKRTLMDFNLACVLFYAIKYAPKTVRAFLIGSGADELLGISMLCWRMMKN